MVDSSISDKVLIEKIEKQRDRNRALFRSAADWIEVLESGASLAKYFLDRNYKSVAIYGAGDLGKLLFKALKNKNIVVEYFIDQAADSNRMRYGLPVYLPDELPGLQLVDVIVVTPIFYFDDISKKLLEVDFGLPIVSLKGVLDEILGEIWYEQQCNHA